MTRVQRRTVEYATLADGTALAFPLIEVTGDRPGPTGLFTGGVHGDEHEGPLALLRLAERLGGMPLAGRVLIVPVANGAALAAGRRTSPLDGQNLARIFPGAAGETPSFRLARAIWALLDGCDFLFDSHSGGIELCFLPVAGFYAASGEVSAEAAAGSLALARATGLPDLWELPPQPGVLSYEAARRGVAVTGCEVGGRGHAGPEAVATYLAAYLRALAERGMIAPVARAAPARLLRGNWRLSPAAGLFEPVAPLGAKVARGDLLARVLSPLGEELHRFTAETDGVVMAERNLCSIGQGDLAVCIATIGATP